MFAETKPPALPRSVPTRTLSPLLTTAAAGAPICCANVMTTSSGGATTVIGTPALILWSWGWIPPILNAVSYTHLDVYKIQLLATIIFCEKKV